MSERKIGEVILDIKNISLRFGGVKALTDISFNVREHEVRAIIGPNGTYRIERSIEVMTDQKPRQLKLFRVLDRGVEFERCNYYD